LNPSAESFIQTCLTNWKLHAWPDVAYLLLGQDASMGVCILKALCANVLQSLKYLQLSVKAPSWV